MTGSQVEVFESCYKHDYCTVGIAGPSAEIISSLQSHESCSITLVDNASSKVPEIPEANFASQHKLQIFLVSISTVTTLEKVLQNLKTSKWWNHMATFLIVDSPIRLDQDCSKAFDILSTAWQMNLLHAKFICHHGTKGPLLYSYNPFTDQAPFFWQVEKTYRRKNKHPWTLLVRKHQDIPEICENLDFDQTKDLGGYEIRASIQPTNINESSSKTDLESVTGFTGTIARYAFRAFNSTSKIFTSDSSKELFGMTFSGYTDIFLSAWYQQNDFHSPMTYPHWRSGVACITQHRGNFSQIEKLLRVIDHSSRYAVVLVCFVTFLFFKFFIRESVSSAILTIVRLICNSSVPNVPNNVAARIYLSGLFVFVVTLQAIYQGQLASLLTKPAPLPDVETFEDLENFQYTIYGHKGLTTYFEKLNFRGRVVGEEYFYCQKYVFRDHAAACINDRNLLLNVASEYDLHLSDMLLPMFVVFMIREDWPFEKRFNTVISRLVEGSIIDHVTMKEFDLTLRKQKSNAKQNDNQSFTVITLKDLAFAFTILGIGLVGATAVFIVEIWKCRRSLNIAKNRVRAMHRKRA